MKILLAVWLLIFGEWPLFDPGHDGDSFASIIDIAIHFLAGVYLLHRWYVSTGYDFRDA